MTMQEVLHIYSDSGRELVERDLAAAGPSLLVGERAKDDLVLVETAAADTNVLAALVRNEDGWLLATADEERPIVAGSQKSSDAQLSAGLPCRIGGYVFRIERDTAETGDVLLWRVSGEGSAVAVDPILGGRNVVATCRGHNRPEVNPAVVDRLVFEFFPTDDALEVSTSRNAADQLTVPRNHLFSVGNVEAMMMTAADAGRAVKSGNPFAWPSRGLRFRLGAAGVCVALVALIAFGYHRDAARYRRLSSQPHGATEVAAPAENAHVAVRDEVVSYDISFYRQMPLVLTARPNPVTADLIQRGRQLTNEVGMAEKIAFLESVTAIQRAVQSARWDDLRTALEAADEKMFGECDADRFLADARMLSSIVTEDLPRQLAEGSVLGKRKEFEQSRRNVGSLMKKLDGNVFMTSKLLVQQRNTGLGYFSSLAAYIDARDRVVEDLAGNPPVLEADDLRRLNDAYADILTELPLDEPTLGEMAKREAVLIRSIAYRGEGFVAMHAKADETDAVTVLLEPLAALAERSGVEMKVVESWRTRAKASRRMLNAKCRRLLASYRLQLTRDRAGAERTLSDILRMSEPASSYHLWAERERRRLAAGAESAAHEAETERDKKPEAAK